MSRECVWFDSFDVEIEGGIVRFTGHSDGETACSRVTEQTAVKFANDILRTVERAHLAELGVVLPFREGVVGH